MSREDDSRTPPVLMEPSGNGAGGWETWEWDESLFSGAARYYERGRPPYAPGIGRALRQELGLDGGGRLLDVGCGPGTVTLLLADLFEAVVGLDADAGMVAEAERLAQERGIGNASWIRARAETLPGGLGRFRVVSFAASFHWMDRPRVAAAARELLEPGGAAVQLDAPGYRLAGPSDGRPVPHPAPPWEAVDALRREWLGPDRRAGQGIRNTSPGDEDAVFRAAGFQPAVEIVVPDGRVIDRDVDDIVANCLSTSSTAPHLFGSGLGQFEEQLRRLLLDTSPSGRFSVGLPDNTIRVWRPL